MTDDLTPQDTIETPIPALEPSWWIDEGVAGVGDKPAWLSDKFKTAADLAKSYSELEKRVGSAPDEYDFSKSKFLDGDYAPIQEFKALAKEKRVPQEVMDKMIDSFDRYMDEFTIDSKEEAVKLGENGKARVEVLDNWIKTNLTKESYEALTGSVRTADGIKALEQLRGKIMENNTVVPSGNDLSSANVVSLADVQAELQTNYEKYKKDPTYRKEITAKLELASKNTNYIDKSSV